MCCVLCVADALYLPEVREHDEGSAFVRGSTVMSDLCDRQTGHTRSTKPNKVLSRPCILYGQCSIVPAKNVTEMGCVLALVIH